jgi:hypothetical protein
MKIDRQNLIDTITYYINDNDFDYLHIRATKSVTGDIKMNIWEDIEFEDD